MTYTITDIQHCGGLVVPKVRAYVKSGNIGFTVEAELGISPADTRQNLVEMFLGRLEEDTRRRALARHLERVIGEFAL